MREIILGTAGHVDHGKTSLVKALTGTDTDRLEEEKRRGITIELGFAFLDLPCGHRLGIIDVPGHERFVKNMVAGAAGIDLVAFIVAADEGIMPQTVEHFEICRLLGVKSGLVIITKKDMVEPDWLDLVKEEVREFLAESFLADAPMVAVSSTTGEGIDEVRDALDLIVRESEFFEAYGPFRLPIDRIFSMKGFGAVVTGTSISGRIRVGESVIIYPKGIETKIRGLQVHGSDVEEAEAGRRTAINLQGIEKDTIDRGDILATAGSLKPSYMLDADFLYLSGNPKKLKNRTRVRVHIGTAEIMGRIVLLEEEELEPGKKTVVQLLLEVPIGTWPGDHYVVRSYSPVRTIGGGVVFNNSPVKRRRFKAENKKFIRLYHEGTPEERILLFLEEAGLSGLTAQDLSVKMGIFGKPFQKLIKGPVSGKKILVIDSDKQLYVEAGVYGGLKKKIEGIVSEFHQGNPLKPGISKEELRSRLFRGKDQKLFHLALQDLIKQNILAQDEAVVRLKDHTVSFAEDEKALRKEVEKIYREAGLKPPTVKELFDRLAGYTQKQVKEILDVLLREELLVKVKEDLYFATTVLGALQQRLVDHIQKHDDIDAQGFKAMTGLSRKFSIPLLEHFDKIKLTIRVGDKRVLR